MALNTIAADARWALGAALGLSMVLGCASTEFFNEGPGQPSDRASGQVPEGSIGACKIPLSKRPPIVNEQLWQDVRPCTARTPARTIRLGIGAGIAGAKSDAEADKNMERTFGILREGQKEDVGNNQLVGMFRGLHEAGLKDPALRDRVARESARAGVCDYSYLLRTMAKAREALSHGNRCAAQVYDPAVRSEVCLFDTSRDEVVWLTSSWSCVAHTGTIGEETSCFRLCSYDDYCAKQVSCGAPDVDLLLCAMGVCLP